MRQRRGGTGGAKASSEDKGSDSKKNLASTTAASSATGRSVPTSTAASNNDANILRATNVAGQQQQQQPQLRRPRHGGWKGKDKEGTEAIMLRGEPGYHLGLFRIAYGMLLVHRTLAFMGTGAVDASFVATGNGVPQHPGAPSATPSPPPSAVLNFAHGFIGSLGSAPTADAIRSACWCLCAGGAALSVGYRSNAVAFGCAILQFYLLLLEKSLYTDEAYLFALVALLLSFTDCGKTLGLDAPSEPDDRARSSGGGGGGGGGGRGLRDQPPDTVPHWHVVLLRFQVCILHIHRGLAKAFTQGWLLEGQPLFGKLEALPSTHIVRQFAQWLALSEVPGLTGISLQAVAVRINVTVVFFDLFLGVSLLAAPHYRPAGLALQTALHLSRAVTGPSNARAWHFLIAASGILFIDHNMLQETLERIQTWLQPAVSFDKGGRPRGGGTARATGGGRRGRGRGTSSSMGEAAAAAVAAAAAGGGTAAAGSAASATSSPIAIQKKKQRPLQPRPSSATAALIFGYVLVQMVVPLRHLATEFPVEWSRDGQEFSWRGGGGTGGRAGSGGLVTEEALVRIVHRSRGAGRREGSDSGSRSRSRKSQAAAAAAVAGDVQTVHLYGAPLTAQQVLRLVLDPDMLRQLARRTAESITTSTKSPKQADNDKAKENGNNMGPKIIRTPPYSHVDAWKSINRRPFSPWIDPTVDVWDARFGGDGPAPGDWLESPPSDDELGRAASTIEMIRDTWAARNQSVTFFAARPGQSLSNIFLGGYDPGNLNTTALCSVPEPPRSYANTDTGGRQAQDAEGSSTSSSSTSSGSGKGVDTDTEDEDADAPLADGGGILLGVLAGEVDLLTDPGDGGSKAKKQRLTNRAWETVVVPTGRGHSVRAAKGAVALAAAAAAPQKRHERNEGLAIWYYVHACPEGLFHLCIGFLSGAGWQALYKPTVGTRKGWVMEHGVPKNWS